MNRHFLLPIIAAVSVSFMTWHLIRTNRVEPMVSPPVEPSRSPYQHTIAGAGLIEPQSENIEVAAVVPGTVHDVRVHVGRPVAKGDVLFRLDDRQRRADLLLQQARQKEAESQLHKQQQLPRPEDIPPSEANVAKAKADVQAQKDLLDRAEELVAKKIWNEQELVQRTQAFLSARALLAAAEAEDARLKAGAWHADLEIARAEVEMARQAVHQAEVEIDRLEVRAPISGTVLKVDVRPGEYVGTPPGQPLIVLGNIDVLHVRVDIDEQDLPRFRSGMPGNGYVRGDAATPLPMRFVRVEPFVEPKRSLTNAGTERVDTRVLQVLYALESPPSTVFVGQQIDVFLDAAHEAVAPGSEAAPKADVVVQ
ncbi:MAG TPA: HlyD family efflux transporter periplasmic adaptor subunit [Planctomycetaceae bacterium]|nr:HlyD family efflux transporter periplasmic adaptor subunit [Planctomycetaceae bacterium]